MAATAETQTPHPLSSTARPSASAPFLTPQRLRLLSYAGGAVLLVAAAAWFMVTANKRKQEYASRALDEARNAAEQGNMAVAVQGFTKVTTSYGGTPAAYEACPRHRPGATGLGAE